jgi:hypothetical protein
MAKFLHLSQNGISKLVHNLHAVKNCARLQINIHGIGEKIIYYAELITSSSKISSSAFQSGWMRGNDKLSCSKEHVNSASTSILQPQPG